MGSDSDSSSSSSESDGDTRQKRGREVDPKDVSDSAMPRMTKKRRAEASREVRDPRIPDLPANVERDDAMQWLASSRWATFTPGKQVNVATTAVNKAILSSNHVAAGY